MGNENEFEIITRAHEAKKRLKSGFWENERMLIAKRYSNRMSDEIISSYYLAGKLKNKVHKDSVLYEKVCEIIEEDDGLNPIGRLLDREYYDTLDRSEKERYVLELANKYRTLRALYFERKKVEDNLSRLTLMS